MDVFYSVTDRDREDIGNEKVRDGIVSGPNGTPNFMWKLIEREIILYSITDDILLKLIGVTDYIHLEITRVMGDIVEGGRRFMW